jgi:hypothetical protein
MLYAVNKQLVVDLSPLGWRHVRVALGVWRKQCEGRPPVEVQNFENAVDALLQRIDSEADRAVELPQSTNTCDLI